MVRIMYNFTEFTEILNNFDINLVKGLNPDDFKDFGVMDSKKYAEKLFRLMNQEALDKEAKTMVVVLATAVRNKKRIISAMKKFAGKSWYKPVLNFFRNRTVQYTYEEEDETFSVVHIPSSVPYMAAKAWLHLTKEPTVEGFLSNLWAAQFPLTSDLMEVQKEWEKNFWTEVVKKGGKNYEAGNFNLGYWETKATDDYLLLDVDGGVFGDKVVIDGKRKYNRECLEKWINKEPYPTLDSTTGLVEEAAASVASGSTGTLPKTKQQTKK